MLPLKCNAPPAPAPAIFPRKSASYILIFVRFAASVVLLVIANAAPAPASAVLYMNRVSVMLMSASSSSAPQTAPFPAAAVLLLKYIPSNTTFSDLLLVRITPFSEFILFTSDSTMIRFTPSKFRKLVPFSALLSCITKVSTAVSRFRKYFPAAFITRSDFTSSSTTSAVSSVPETRIRSSAASTT